MPDERGFPHKARLDFLDNRLDQGTGTLRARGVMANAAGLFSPGMFARVRVTGYGPLHGSPAPRRGHRHRPDQQVRLRGGRGRHVARRNVKLGPLHERLRVVREGVAAEEWVIIRGLQRARPGIKVAPKREALTLSEAPAAKPAGKAQE